MKTLLSALLVCAALGSSPAYTQILDRESYAARLPDIEEGSLKPENKKILCPFHRMLERAGLYDSSKDEQGALTVSILKISELARKFGCMVSGCGTVATAVSGGQLVTLSTTLGKVNLEALHKSFGISHECGLAFPKGSAEVTDAHRAETLRRMAARADANGRLALEDLEAVKESICADQGVKNTLAGQTEVRLIFAFLGGKERGFIDYADVERFFHAELPKTIAAPNVGLNSL